MLGLTVSMRSMQASSSSTGEIWRCAISSRNSTAERVTRSAEEDAVMDRAGDEGREQGAAASIGLDVGARGGGAHQRQFTFDQGAGLGSGGEAGLQPLVVQGLAHARVGQGVAQRFCSLALTGALAPRGATSMTQESS